MKQFYAVCTLFLVSCVCYAQVRQGDMGIGASIAMPSGFSSSVVSTNGSTQGSALGAINFTVTGGSMISYMMSQSLELQGGLGVGLVSFSVSTGTAPDSRNTASIMAGIRSYMRAMNEVSPYMGGSVSYTMIPTVKNQGTGGGETTGYVLMLNVYYGAQAFIAKNVAVFTQMGVGYNAGSITSTAGGVSVSGGVNTITIGSAAMGFNIYWN